jgi:hypothetical protein
VSKVNEIYGLDEFPAIHEFLRDRARISSQSWRSGLVQIWPIRLSKTAEIASYFEEFANEASIKDGLKLRCQNVKLFLRDPLLLNS